MRKQSDPNTERTKNGYIQPKGGFGTLTSQHQRANTANTSLPIRNGNPIQGISSRIWKNALAKAGIADFRWHDLRHTWATWQRKAGTPTYELQRLGGWKTVSMVDRYAHIAPEGLQAAALRLDNIIHGYRQATPPGVNAVEMLVGPVGFEPTTKGL